MLLHRHIHETIHKGGKTVEQIADALEVHPNTVYCYGLPWFGWQKTGTPPSLLKFRKLIQVTGDCQALDHLEEEVGRVAVPLPNIDGAPSRELSDALMKSAAEYGDVARCSGDAINNGRVTEAVANNLDKEITEAIQALLSIKKIVRARVR